MSLASKLAIVFFTITLMAIGGLSCNCCTL